jgi:hypothetical protein
MNRKILLTVLALAVVLLATPFIGTVMAGKGQEKLDFKFVLVGTYAAPGKTLEAGSSAHYWDMPFIATGWAGPSPPPEPPLALVIGGVAIQGNLLSYTGSMRVNENENGAETIKVTETITIYASDGSVRGTLELHVMGNVEQGQGVGAGDNFIGFGTGDFAGVKISGSTPGGPVLLGLVPSGLPPPAPAMLPIFQLTRIGTVMGWPT